MARPGRGRTVQFHASTSYEQFVGGLAPVAKDGHFGFEPKPGVLMDAAREAVFLPVRPPSTFEETVERLGILIEDHEVDADMMETFGSLLTFAKAKTLR